MTKSESRKIWRQPWGYPEAILIALELLIAGLAIDYFTRIPFPKPGFPVNIILLAFLIILLIALHLLRKRSAFIRWLSSVPAAVSSLGLFTLISVMMGLIPQKNMNIPAIQNLLDSWAYLFSYIYLLIVLGMSALKRIRPLKARNTAFLLNHFGLWVALAAAGFGAGEVQKLDMYLREGKTTWFAYNQNRQPKELPFALELNDFVMTNYPPKLALIDPETKKIYKRNAKPVITDLPLNDRQHMAGYKIKTLQYADYAVPLDKNTWKAVRDSGAVQAARIAVNDSIRGWVSPGNYMYPRSILRINDSTSLAMLDPEPEKYASEVRVFTPEGEKYKAVIEVNKPLKITGWKIYQSGYNQKHGRWSQISILELVRDPWLPYVYAGLFLMIAGAVWLIFQGKIQKQ